MTTRITVALLLSAATLANSRSLPLMIARDSKLTHACGLAGRLRRDLRHPPEIFDLPHLLLFAKWNIDPEDIPRAWRSPTGHGI